MNVHTIFSFLHSLRDPHPPKDSEPPAVTEHCCCVRDGMLVRENGDVGHKRQVQKQFYESKWIRSDGSIEQREIGSSKHNAITEELSLPIHVADFLSLSCASWSLRSAMGFLSTSRLVRD